MAATNLSETARPLALALLFLLSITGCGGRPVAPKVLLLISVDTLRADRLGAYGSELQLTPNLDRLAAESQVFTRAFAPTSFTLPSVSSLLTGRYPEEIGVLGNRSALRPAVPTLATVLRSRGWRTAAVVSNLVLKEKAGLAVGFDVYDDDLPGTEATRKWPERTAGDTTDAAIRTLESFASDRGDRLFLWVHYQDPHGPYTPPAGLRDRFLEAEQRRADGGRRLPAAVGNRGRGHLPGYQVVDGRRDVAFYRAGYDAEVHYLDREAGRLIDDVRRRGWTDECVLVFTADHGESLGENDYWFAHGDRLDDALIRVPLLIRIPGTPPRRRDDLASLVDLFPTLLAHLEGIPPESDSEGRNLFAAGAAGTDSHPYLATLGSGGPIRIGIVSDAYKLVLTQQKQSVRSELFRIGQEGVDLSSAEPERVARMHAELVERRARLRRGPGETRQQLSDEDREQLRALGYVEESEPLERD
jgi:arylsulfatase